MTSPGAAEVQLTWRGTVTDHELAELTAAHGGHPEPGWWDRVRPHSLGWVAARSTAGLLVGFVNVAWDGGDHAFLIDTKTHPDFQRRGIATAVVAEATRRARDADCEWLHVDFEAHLATFYLDSCGFVPPQGAGLLHLTDEPTH